MGYLAMPQRIVPADLVIEDPGRLPALRPVSAGFITRDGVDPDEFAPLAAALEGAVHQD
jgi:hypothetical protein